MVMMCGPADYAALAVCATRVAIALASIGGLAIAYHFRTALSSAFNKVTEKAGSNLLPD